MQRFVLNLRAFLFLFRVQVRSLQLTTKSSPRIVNQVKISTTWSVGNGSQASDNNLKIKNSSLTIENRQRHFSIAEPDFDRDNRTRYRHLTLLLLFDCQTSSQYNRAEVYKLSPWLQVQHKQRALRPSITQAPTYIAHPPFKSTLWTHSPLSSPSSRAPKSRHHRQMLAR